MSFFVEDFIFHTLFAFLGLALVLGCFAFMWTVAGLAGVAVLLLMVVASCCIGYYATVHVNS